MSRHGRRLLVLICLLLGSCATPQPTATVISTPVSAATETSAPVVPTQTSELPPASCPITRPPAIPFVPPAPYPPKPPPGYAGQFWYGTPELWTMLGSDGTWQSLPHSAAGYSQKVFWWRQGYSMDAEPLPALTVTGKRLDAFAPPLETDKATNASADFGQAMLIGVDIPARLLGDHRQLPRPRPELCGMGRAVEVTFPAAPFPTLSSIHIGTGYPG